MKLTGTARLAALDQGRAGINEAINGLVKDIRTLDGLDGVDPGEIVIALAQVLSEDIDHGRLGLLVAGALLRLAEEPEMSDSPFPTQPELNEEDAGEFHRIIAWIHANDMTHEWMVGEQPADYIIRLLTSLKRSQQ